jgi:hypothetical protein
MEECSSTGIGIVTFDNDLVRKISFLNGSSGGKTSNGKGNNGEERKTSHIEIE